MVQEKATRETPELKLESTEHAGKEVKKTEPEKVVKQ
jgi:hypothetical protein